MSASAATIEQEHAAFRPYLDMIKRVADEAGERPIEDTRADLSAIHEFLAHTLMPHAVAEGRLLFPVVRHEGGEAILGVRMTQCHVQLEKLTEELDRLIPELAPGKASKDGEREVRRILYSVHTLLSSHLDEAQADVEPLLEAKLSPEDRVELFAAIERTAEQVADLYE